MVNKFQQFFIKLKDKIQSSWHYLVDLAVNKINIKKIYSVWIAGPIIGFLNYFDNKPGLKYGFLCAGLSILFSGASFLTIFISVSLVYFMYNYLHQGLSGDKNSLVNNIFSAFQNGLLASALLVLLNFSPLIGFFVGHTLASIFYSLKSYFTGYPSESFVMDSLESLDTNPIRKGYLAGTISVTQSIGLAEKDQAIYPLVTFLMNVRRCFEQTQQGTPNPPEPVTPRLD